MMDSEAQQPKKAKARRRSAAEVREAAEARHEARPRRAAQRVQAQVQAQAQRKGQVVPGVEANVGGRPSLPPTEQHLHPVTVRLDSQQFEQLCTYVVPGGRTLAATVRTALLGIPQFTTEEHQLLRRVPDLVNLASIIAERLAGIDPVAAAEWTALAGRLDAFLNGLHY